MSKKRRRDKRDERIEELEDKWKRAVADYRNLEKRVESERGNYVKLANAGLIVKLLEVVDALERAAKHIKDSGVNMIASQMMEVLKSEGVEEIRVKGSEFDPEKMEAVEVVPGEKNKVIKVVKKGYNLNKVVLRPAEVEVGKG